MREIEAAYGQGKAITIAASIAWKDALTQLVDETNARLGRIDILVCNAVSNPYFGPMAAISDEQLREILDNNIVSNHWLIQMIAPQMLKRGDGSITIVSSIGALMGSIVIGAYNISKAADLQLARNYAVELGSRNVRVNCICPGLIKTDFAKALWQIRIYSKWPSARPHCEVSAIRTTLSEQCTAKNREGALHAALTCLQMA